MTEIANLIIKVDSSAPKDAANDLNRLHDSSKKAEAGVGGLFSAFKRLLGPALALVSVTAGLNKLLNTAKTFESLNAQLKTATGSAEKAAIAFEALTDFATQTPFDLAQTTDAFIKLVNLGLTPSERALRSYGDTASAMGKSMTQMIEAVADAATGEFERLKEFGIKASNEGDKIAFRFRGSTTRIKNDAASIEAFLIQLGENNFAGAMADRMGTLEGKLSNLGDAWDQMFNAIAKAGAGEFIKQAIDLAISAVQELTDMFASGQIQGYIDAWGKRFVELGTDISDTFGFIGKYIAEMFKGSEDDVKGAVDFIIDAFTFMPERVWAFIKITGKTIGTLASYAASTGRAIYDSLVAWFNYLVETSKNIGKEIMANLNPFDDSENAFIDRQKAAYAEMGKTVSDAFVKRGLEIEKARDSYLDYTNAIIDGTMATEAAFKQDISNADKLRAAYDAAQKAKAELRAANPTDRLEGFSTAATGPAAPTKSQMSGFENLREQLQLEEKSIAESYAKRYELIRVNTQAGSDLQLELTKQLNDAVAAEYEKAYSERFDRIETLDKAMNDAIASGRMSQVETLAMQMRAEEEEIMRSYEFRLNQILADTRTTEEQKAALMEELNSKYASREKELELARTAQTVQNSAALFDSLADIAATAAGKQSGLYKTLFAASKAFAIADSIVKIQQGIASAAATPFPANIAAMASVAAATSSILSNIQSVNMTFAGAYEHGGMIPAGKWGLVGETGLAEKVRGPAIVTSAKATQSAMKGQGGGDSAPITINVTNTSGAQIDVTERQTDNGRVVEIAVQRAKNEISRDIRTGSGSINSALESSYGIRRSAA